jgi:hypothetical protein
VLKHDFRAAPRHLTAGLGTYVGRSNISKHLDDVFYSTFVPVQRGAIAAGEGKDISKREVT